MPKKDPKEWSPRHRIQQLEKLAREMVGDEHKPDLFFVSVEGNIVLISKDFDIAYEYWQRLSSDQDLETALEDRLTGVIASVEPESDEPDAPLVTIDSSHMFGFR